MQVAARIDALRAHLAPWRRAGERIALVPTMGDLHDGHLALVRLARRDADRVVVSIFVNPLQFAPGEDLAGYPRTPGEDQEALRGLGVDAVFAPPVEEIYPRGAGPHTRVAVGALGEILCGAHRRGHFDGVATVVVKLFNIVQPDAAVFGEKDFQQLMIIRRLAADLDFPVDVIGAPTQRHADGLALSSRNRYLGEAERRVAPRLYATLQAVAGRLESGERDFSDLERFGAARLREAGLRPDYFEIRDAADLSRPGEASVDIVVLAAAHLGRARLIDNLTVPRPPV